MSQEPINLTSPMVTSYTILIQYEDQEADIHSPQSLSKFHQIYMHVCVVLGNLNTRVA